MRKGQLLILESTSYPGTTREQICNKLNMKFKIGSEFFVGFSSERINPGINDGQIERIPKVVSGYDKKCLELCAKFYGMLFQNIVIAKSLEKQSFQNY